MSHMGRFYEEGSMNKGGLGSFVGGSDTISVGISTPIFDIGYSSGRNFEGQETGRGVSMSFKNPFTSGNSWGAEATAGFAMISIFGCSMP